jgi:uroporphyrinogen-III synthase
MTALSSSTPATLPSPAPYSFTPGQAYSFKKPLILLLKTRSSPVDGYESFFSTNSTRKSGSSESRSDGDADGYADDGGGMQQLRYHPVFIPVLEHRFHRENLTAVKGILLSGGFNFGIEQQADEKSQGQRYGGLIFTSQRAVEAFGKMLEEGNGMSSFVFIKKLRDLSIHNRAGS